MKDKKDLNMNKLYNIMGIRKQGDFRYVLGELDLISTGLFFIGLLLTQNTSTCFSWSCSSVGLILMAIGVLKQISGK